MGLSIRHRFQSFDVVQRWCPDEMDQRLEFASCRYCSFPCDTLPLMNQPTRWTSTTSILSIVGRVAHRHTGAHVKGRQSRLDDLAPTRRVGAAVTSGAQTMVLAHELPRIECNMELRRYHSAVGSAVSYCTALLCIVRGQGLSMLCRAAFSKGQCSASRPESRV
jgi:hypothetical protein